MIGTRDRKRTLREGCTRRAPCTRISPFEGWYLGVDGSSRSNQGRHTRFYDNRRAKTPLIPGDVRTGTSQVSFHRLCTHDSPSPPPFLSLSRRKTSFVRFEIEKLGLLLDRSWRRSYDLENSGDRIVENSDNPLRKDRISTICG